MKITIIGRRFEVTDEIKEKIEKKLGKLDKFFDDEAKANVTMRSERNKEILETTILYNGTMFRAEVAEEKITASLDKTIDIIERQIRKNKTRLEKQLKSGVFDRGVSDFPAEQEEEFKVTRTKHFVVRQMSIDEAILQMNLLGHTFFLFRNDTDGNMNLVYKKKNNEYGVIEPVEE